MTPFQSSFSTIAAINGKLLGSAVTTALGLYLWPETAQGWAFGVMSIFLWVSALTFLIEALKAAAQLYVRDKAVAAYLAQGAKPKTAEMASPEALRKAGLIDG
jgi:hypothetical protein